MTFGFNPLVSEWSPFHGALYVVVEAVAKVTAIGGNYKRVRLTFQEYFERLEENAEKWGKPFSALFGALMAQRELGIPAIGGKDSMSGTFNDINVPPTLVAFAVDVIDVNKVISSEFKKTDSKVVLIPLKRDKNEIPNFNQMKGNFTKIHELAKEKKILASYTVKGGGIAEAISKMAFGNGIGFAFNGDVDISNLFTPDYGSIVLELSARENLEVLLDGIEYFLLGSTQKKPEITINRTSIDLEEAIARWQQPLETVFPSKTQLVSGKAKLFSLNVSAESLRPIKKEGKKLMALLGPEYLFLYSLEQM